jgi:tetratricopeptide (TPR) repeat protein
MLFERQGDRQKAGLDYRKALEVDKSYLPAYNNLAAMLMDGGNYQEAERLLTAALEVKPDYAYAMLNRGLSRYKLGDCAGATGDLSLALAANPKFELAYYHRALCARKAGNTPAAMKDLDALLALNPAAALAWFERGKALYSFKDYDGAAGEFLKAQQLSSADPSFSFWRAQALYRAGQNEAALEAAASAVELRPDSHQAECLLGDVYGTLKDLKSAEEHYLKAAQLAPQYASVYKARLAALNAPVKRRPAPRKRN